MDANLKEVLVTYAPIIGAIFTAWIAYRQAMNAKDNKATRDAVIEIKHQTNDMTRKMVDSAGTAGRAEGKAQEQLDQLSRDRKP